MLSVRVLYFFTLFVNGLTDTFGNELDSMLYADDLKLYSSYELDSPNLLQNALDTIVKWSSEWQFLLKPSNSNDLYLGKTNSKLVYTINSVEILRLVFSLGILGLIVALNSAVMCTILSCCHTGCQFY